MGVGAIDEDKELNKERMREMRQNKEYREKENANMREMRQNKEYREKKNANMRELRQNEEYRERERANDADGKKRKWDSTPEKQKEEKRRQMRDRARERRAEKKARKRDSTPEKQKEENRRQKRERARERRAERRARKIMEPKGYVENEEEWLVKKPVPKYKDPKDPSKGFDGFHTGSFAVDEKKSNVSDGKYRDDHGRHYLGEMNKECGHCGALGFEAEEQGKFVNSEIPDGEKLLHSGNLCCCRGRVDGVFDYNLPEELDHLYTSPDDPLAVHFRNNTKAYNNGMAHVLCCCSKRLEE